MVAPVVKPSAYYGVNTPAFFTLRGSSLRDSYSGSTPAFQAGGTGSIPVSRSSSATAKDEQAVGGVIRDALA